MYDSLILIFYFHLVHCKFIFGHGWLHNNKFGKTCQKNCPSWRCLLCMMASWLRLSPLPGVETRFNTHNQNASANAFRNAFLELLRLSSISQNHEYGYTVRPRKKKKQIPETKGCCDQVQGCMTVVIPSS